MAKPPKSPKRRKHPFLDWLALNVGAPIIYLISRLIGFTLRQRRGEQEHEFYADVARGRRFIIAFWHGDSFLLARDMRRVFGYGDLYLMASRSRDGTLMGRILTLFGARIARGSSSRGGARALLEMIGAMTSRDFGGLAVDAPRGPRHTINKNGILLLAKHTGLPIVPVAAHAGRKWMARSWDRMEIPLPFSRVEIAYGEPFPVPPEADDAAIDAMRVELQRRLRELKGEHDG